MLNNGGNHLENINKRISALISRYQLDKDDMKSLIKPDWLIGHWNGKVYGNWKKYIYLDNKKKILTNKELNQIKNIKG